MSSDGFPASIAALEVARQVLTVAHRQNITLPHLELCWATGEPALEVKWFPNIGSPEEREPALPLIGKVASAFLPEGAVWHSIGTASSYATEVDGTSVEFTIYR